MTLMTVSAPVVSLVCPLRQPLGSAALSSLSWQQSLLSRLLVVVGLLAAALVVGLLLEAAVAVVAVAAVAVAVAVAFR